jgi:hypothetical protein
MKGGALAEGNAQNESFSEKRSSGSCPDQALADRLEPARTIAQEANPTRRSEPVPGSGT